jgi:hypothetical protein
VGAYFSAHRTAGLGLDRVLHPGDPPLVSVVSGPYADLISAWQRAAHIRERRRDYVLIAGEMLSATASSFF